MRVIRKHLMMMFSLYSSYIGFRRVEGDHKLHRIDDVLNVETNKDVGYGGMRGGLAAS